MTQTKTSNGVWKWIAVGLSGIIVTMATTGTMSFLAFLQESPSGTNHRELVSEVHRNSLAIAALQGEIKARLTNIEKILEEKQKD